jgi:hypothetical protein
MPARPGSPRRRIRLRADGGRRPQTHAAPEAVQQCQPERVAAIISAATPVGTRRSGDGPSPAPPHREPADDRGRAPLARSEAARHGAGRSRAARAPATPKRAASRRKGGSAARPPRVRGRSAYTVHHRGLRHREPGGSAVRRHRERAVEPVQVSNRSRSRPRCPRADSAQPWRYSPGSTVTTSPGQALVAATARPGPRAPPAPPRGRARGRTAPPRWDRSSGLRVVGSRRPRRDRTSASTDLPATPGQIARARGRAPLDGRSASEPGTARQAQKVQVMSRSSGSCAGRGGRGAHDERARPDVVQVSRARLPR